MCVHTNKATVALRNMVLHMFEKQIETSRIAKTCALLYMSGLSVRDIPEYVINRCISSQKGDGGFIGNCDTIWMAKLLEFFPEYKEERQAAIEWLMKGNGCEPGWGRNKRDIHRIPVTGLALFLLPELASECVLRWLEYTWLSEVNSLTYKGAYVVLAFKRCHYKPMLNKMLIEETADWLATQQQNDGGFAPWHNHPVGANVLCTALSVLAVVCMDNSAYKNVINKGYDYLCQTQCGSGIWPFHEIEDGAAWGLYTLSQVEQYLRTERCVY